VRFGTTYPTLDLGTDPAVLRDWAVGVESIGFDELFIPEHVVGINVASHPGWNPLNPNTLRPGPPIYDHLDPFLEPLVAMGFLAAVTSRITLTSGVLIAPQRQTALLAKQAAIADVLSNGRVRLGVGIGWNDAEFEALGADFGQRGRRLDEQIHVLRRMWSEESVTFAGRYDRLLGAGLCPMPVQQPIPLLIGGDSEAARERAARLGDGWFITHSAAEAADRCARFWARVDDLGRRDGMSLVGTIQLGTRAGAQVLPDIVAWRDLGATGLNLRTSRYAPGAPHRGRVRSAEVDEHLNALDAARRAYLAPR
jgi:probable F420-dependent oxidoreductase